MDNLIEFFKNDKFAAHCGIELIEVTPGFSHCSMKITQNHENALGTVMGGAIFSLADYTLGVAANSHGTLAVSLNVMINYVKPGYGPLLSATAKEVTRTRSTGVYQIIVCDEKEATIATATGTCYYKNKPILNT